MERIVLLIFFTRMGKKATKKILINLIYDDLRHQHLILGMNLLGADCGDLFLDIAQSVFFFMNLNTSDLRLQHLTDQYMERAYRVLEFAFSDNESFEYLAIEIYNWLSEERRVYRKKLELGT